MENSPIFSNFGSFSDLLRKNCFPWKWLDGFRNCLNHNNGVKICLVSSVMRVERERERYLAGGVMTVWQYYCVVPSQGQARLYSQSSQYRCGHTVTVTLLTPPLSTNILFMASKDYNCPRFCVIWEVLFRPVKYSLTTGGMLSDISSGLEISQTVWEVILIERWWYLYQYTMAVHIFWQQSLL